MPVALKKDERAPARLEPAGVEAAEVARRQRTILALWASPTMTCRSNDPGACSGESRGYSQRSSMQIGPGLETEILGLLREDPVRGVISSDWLE